MLQDGIECIHHRVVPSTVAGHHEARSTALVHEELAQVAVLPAKLVARVLELT